MISCGFRFAFLFAMSEINTVPSKGNSGVSSLTCAGVRLAERPRLSVITNCPPFVLYSGVLSSLLLLCARLGALPLGAAAAEAWSSIGKRLSACTCALCAARTWLNPSIRLATNLAWPNAISLLGVFPLFSSLEGTTSGEAAGCSMAIIGGFASVDDELGLW